MSECSMGRVLSAAGVGEEASFFGGGAEELVFGIWVVFGQ